jgi:hypothetical protein
MKSLLCLFLLLLLQLLPQFAFASHTPNAVIKTLLFRPAAAAAAANTCCPDLLFEPLLQP